MMRLLIHFPFAFLFLSSLYRLKLKGMQSQIIIITIITKVNLTASAGVNVSKIAECVSFTITIYNHLKLPFIQWRWCGQGPSSLNWGWMEWSVVGIILWQNKQLYTRNEINKNNYGDVQRLKGSLNDDIVSIRHTRLCWR